MIARVAAAGRFEGWASRIDGDRITFTKGTAPTGDLVQIEVRVGADGSVSTC